MAKKAKTKGQHGGRREGSGKPAWFRGKTVGANTLDPLVGKVRKYIAVRLTAKGWENVDAKIGSTSRPGELNRARTEAEPPVSYSDYFETLSRLYGSRITIDDIRRAARMK